MEPRVWRVIFALWRAVRRDLGSFASARANNFFLFVAVMMYGALNSGLAPVSSYPFLALIGLLALFPLAGDPLSKIPASRLATWPLRPAQRAGLRAAALALSPMSWIAAALLVATSKAALALIAIPLVSHGLRAPGWQPLRRMPGLPGRLAEPTRANLRQMFSVLDTYLAGAIAAAGHLPFVPTDARPVLAMLAALALSTYAQCLFSLDGSRTRYRLLPFAGWQVILAKDAAYLGVLLAFTAGLRPAAALTFGLVALTIGRYPSVALHLPVQRWRFAGGRVLFGAAQMVAGIGMASAETAFGPAVLAAALAPYAASVWLGGRSLMQDSVVRQ